MSNRTAIILKNCVQCGLGFSSTNKKRLTCSRACAVALSWKSCGDKRRASIIIARNRLESRNRSTEVNNRRWAKPGEREKLSKLNRKRWANPRKRAKLIKAITATHSTPEMRAFYSERRKQDWQRPEFREAVVAGMRAHHSRPEARAKFSELLRERWNNPSIRVKMEAANRRTAKNPELRAANGERMRLKWATDENFRSTVVEASRLYHRSPESRALKSARLKAMWADPIWRLRQRNLVGLAAAAAAAAAAGKKNAGLEAIAAKALDSATDLIALVDKHVSRALPDFMRADICQDIMVALLEGSLSIIDLKRGAKEHLTQYRKLFPDKFGPISLDAPIPGTDGGLRLVDTLSNDSPHF